MATFLEELDNFRMEEESAQQFFFGYLSLQLVPGANSAVLSKLNDAPTFWRTSRYAMLLSAFVALGRIFDQDPKSIHNIDRLLRAVSDEIALFDPTALAQRRISDGMSPAAAASYAAGTHTLTPNEVREMRKAVLQWRRIYEARYRDVRHLVFAHRGIARADADALMALAKIDEMKEMLGFLDALHKSLWELHANGRKPDLAPTLFILPPDRAYANAAGERIYRESMDLQFGMLSLSDIERIRD